MNRHPIPGFEPVFQVIQAIGPPGDHAQVIAVSGQTLRAVALIAWMLSLMLAAVSIGPAGHSDAGASSSTSHAAKSCKAGRPCYPIKHIVFMVKENRSFDSLFGRHPGVNGAATYRPPT